MLDLGCSGLQHHHQLLVSPFNEYCLLCEEVMINFIHNKDLIQPSLKFIHSFSHKKVLNEIYYVGVDPWKVPLEAYNFS